jgi:RNA polymerase sigma-70 factor (ECF subfamily)
MEPTDGYERAIYEQVETLFKENRRLIFRAAFRITRNKDDAKEVLQNVFVKLIREKRPPQDFIKNPAGYLRRAATNEAFSLIRSPYEQRLSDEKIDWDQLPASGADTNEDPRIERLRAAMGKLKPGLLEVLNLYYDEEYNCSEIAVLQGKMSATVWKDLSIARRELKRLVRKEEKHREKATDQGTRKETLADASGTRDREVRTRGLGEAEGGNVEARPVLPLPVRRRVDGASSEAAGVPGSDGSIDV